MFEYCSGSCSCLVLCRGILVQRRGNNKYNIIFESSLVFHGVLDQVRNRLEDGGPNRGHEQHVDDLEVEEELLNAEVHPGLGLQDEEVAEDVPERGGDVTHERRQRQRADDAVPRRGEHVVVRDLQYSIV